MVLYELLMRIVGTKKANFFFYKDLARLFKEKINLQDLSIPIKLKFARFGAHNSFSREIV